MEIAVERQQQVPDAPEGVLVFAARVEMLQELEIIPKPEDPPKKRPGRPKGSKNKPKATPPESIPATEKPKRGRPKGSKNRPKITDNSVGAGS